MAFGGGIPTWAQPRAIDIGQFVDSETLRSDFGEYLLELRRPSAEEATPPSPATERFVPIPLTVDLKGLVFYPKAEFEAAGYEVPSQLGRA